MATAANKELRSFDRADATRTFERGRFDEVTVGGVTIGRASYEPGWKWSDHVGRALGQASCPVEHVGVVLSGRAAVRMDNGEEFVLSPGEAFWIAPGHDSWVVGDEPYV